MDIIDFGIGTQLVPLDHVAEHLHIPPAALGIIVKESGLNTINIGGITHIGIWQFRLLLTHLAGFNSRHYDLDRIARRDPTATRIPRMNHTLLREAMGQLIIARRAQKGSILSGSQQKLDDMINSWIIFLENSKEAIKRSAANLVDSLHLDEPADPTADPAAEPGDQDAA